MKAGEKRVTEDETVRWHHRSMHINLGELQEMGRDREARCAVVHESWRVRHNLVTEQLHKIESEVDTGACNGLN